MYLFQYLSCLACIHIFCLFCTELICLQLHCQVFMTKKNKDKYFSHNICTRSNILKGRVISGKIINLKDLHVSYKLQYFIIMAVNYYASKLELLINTYFKCGKQIEQEDVRIKPGPLLLCCSYCRLIFLQTKSLFLL